MLANLSPLKIKLVRESFELQNGEPDLDSSLPPALSLSQRSFNITNSSFVFRMKCNEEAATRLDDLRPLPSQMLFIWQTYQEYVGPLVAVLHAPTVTKMILDCKGQIETLGPSVEPLMFAISTAAINSLSEEEVWGDHRSFLQSCLAEPNRQYLGENYFQSEQGRFHSTAAPRHGTCALSSRLHKYQQSVSPTSSCHSCFYPSQR